MAKKYIDAEKLIALIDAKLKDLGLSGSVWVGRNVLQDLKNDILTSLQQERQEVDIRSELEKYIFPISVETMKQEPFTQLEKCAHYFYELGLKSK